ncbi:MAG TPA: thioredoxin family protein [Terriglobales bacterium]|nr:thioredoxin family protein [Terriglobales bacterium]
MNLDIKVLGTGCFRCRQLYSEAEKAVSRLGAPATLSKVEDIKEIMAYKILATPALVINGRVKSSGRIPEAAEIMTWLEMAAQEPAVFPQ